MSATEDTFLLGVDILSVLGKNRPPVVAGGIFPTSAPELSLKLSRGTIDFILAGEAEETFSEFCRKLENGSDISNIKGLYTLINGKQIKNPLPEIIDLNNVPRPDYSLFAESRFYRPMHGKLRRMLPIETHRGCPYQCTFCSVPSIKKMYSKCGMTFFRKKKLDKVHRDLLVCRDEYKADSFYFTADTFLSWSDREFDEFCEIYSDFKLPFWIQTRAETVVEKRLKRLQEVGLLRLSFGIEHGDEEFREKILGRKVKNSLLINKLNLAAEVGVPISVNNIIGFPTETRELAFKTIELNRHIKSDGVNAYTFAPFHGTPLRIMSEELGLIAHEVLAKSVTSLSMLDMPYFTKEEIEGIRRCFVLYAKLPETFWPRVRQAEELTPEGDKVFEDLKAECLANYMHY